MSTSMDFMLFPRTPRDDCHVVLVNVHVVSARLFKQSYSSVACLLAWLILIVFILLSFQFSWRLKSHSTGDATSGLNFSK